MSESDLRYMLDLIALGDKAAFEAFYHELKTPAFTIILRIVGDPSLAEDTLQELFVKLYLAPPGKDVRKLRAYIFQMARNLAIDQLKKRQNEMLSAREIFRSKEEALDGEIPDQINLLGIAERLDLENALGQLALTERQIIALHIYGGLKFREVGEIMGLPLGTVLWKYRQALKKLRSLLEGGIL